MIEVEHIVKKYASVVAIDDISFKVETGEIVGFLGPNGAGKSTMMNIITGYLSATSGNVRVDGIDILENPIEAKKKIGFLPEIPPLYLDMTVKEYLNFVYELKQCKLSRQEHIDEICRVVKIEDVYNRVIKHLSKGYRQRVGIAQALVGNPPVIIFDEPTVGLDPVQIIEIRNLIKTLGKKHTVILSTHILSEVQSVCDRVIVINKGKLAADEKTVELQKDSDSTIKYSAKICGPRTLVLKAIRGLDGVIKAGCAGAGEENSLIYIFEAESCAEIRKPLFSILSEHGWPLVGLEKADASLEDAFMRIVSDADDGAEEENSQTGKNDVQEG